MFPIVTQAAGESSRCPRLSCPGVLCPKLPWSPWRHRFLPNIFLQKDVLAAAWDVFGPRFPEFERFSSIFANTGIVKRHGVKPFDWYLEPRGWPERTEAFLEGAEALFVDVAEKALANARPRRPRHRHRRDRLLPPASRRRAWRRASLAGWAFAPTSRACRCSASAAPAAFPACRSPRAWRRRGRAPTCCW